MTKPYMFSGIALAIIGFILAPVSYFIIKSVFVTSIGISILILGPTCIGLAYTEMRNTGVKGIIVRIQNILLISLALTFSVIDILLALSNQHDITVYFILNAIVYFIIKTFFC